MVGVRQKELREAATAAQDAPGRDLPGEDQGVGAYGDVDGVAVPLLDGWIRSARTAADSGRSMPAGARRLEGDGVDVLGADGGVGRSTSAGAGWDPA